MATVQTNPPIDACRARMESLKPQALSALRTMVNTNSFTHNPEGVNRVGDQTAALFEALGFNVVRRQAIECAMYPSGGLGKHLILTRPGKSTRRIGLVGHLDTVYTEQEEMDHHFQWRESGDRIYGPGTVDIKGGNITIWMVLATMRDTMPALFDSVTWVVMFNAAEEGLSSDFCTVQREQLGDGKALANLVFEGIKYEAGKYEVVAQRKGRAKVEAIAFGRAAHAGSKHPRGVNAIVQLSKFISSVSELTDYNRELTCNVGTVLGGLTTNRVPDRAEANLELRAFAPDVLDGAIASAEQLDGVSLLTSPHDGYAAQMQVRCVQKAPCWPHNDQTQRLVEIWQEAGESLAMKVDPLSKGGLSDGNFTYDFVPTIDGLGPPGSNAHCPKRSADGAVDQEYFLPDHMVPCGMLSLLGIHELVRQAGLIDSA